MKMAPFFCGGGVLTMALVLAACGQAEPVATPVAPRVSTVLLASSPLNVTEDLPGRVAAWRVAEIRPQISGIIRQRLFEQGREVQAGQPLFQIDPAAFVADRDSAAAALQRAKTVLAHAQAQTQRLAPLVEADAISRQGYDDAVAQRDQAAADVAQAKAILARRQLDLKFATVDAPISGRIDQTLVTEGALVSSADSSPMARIQQIDKVYVDVRRPAASLDALSQALSQPGEDADHGVPITILRSDGQVHDVRGRILFSGINVDASAGDVLLRVQVDNPQRQLLPGMFVRVRVPRARYADALSVPQQAVVRLAGKAYVWTLDAQHLAHLTPVELAELVNRRYRVVSGLKQGQRIVIEGMERLIDGSPAIPREHAAATPAAG